MQHKLTARIIKIEDEIDFKLRLMQVFKSLLNFTKEKAAKAFYSNAINELCNEAFKLGAEHERARERLKTEINLFIYNQLN